MLVACVCVWHAWGRWGLKRNVEAGDRGSLVSGFQTIAESAVRSSAPHHIPNGSISEVDPVSCWQSLSLSQPSEIFLHDVK